MPDSHRGRPIRAAASRAGAAACALAAVVLWAAPAARGAALPHAARDRWFEARSERFVVCSNAGEGPAVQVARHLERLAETLDHIPAGFRVDGAPAVRVFAFRDHQSWAPYSPFRESGDERGTGFHVPGDDAEYVAFWIPDGGPDLRFASHEYLHAVVDRSFGLLPTWANEGLAELFGTFTAHGRLASFGALVPEHLAWLREHHVGIAELVSERNDSPDYVGLRNANTLYAESWALTHMLFFDPASRGLRFPRLLADMAGGAAGLTALEAVYGGRAPDSLLRELMAYTGSPAAPARFVFGTDMAAAPVRVRPMTRAETESALGELVLHSRPAESAPAREHLVQAWAHDSTRAITAALLGELAGSEGDLAGQERWFACVERSGSDDARAAGIAGASLARRRVRSGEPFRWPAPGADPLALRARALLARAIRLDPTPAAWLVPYALTFLDDSAGAAAGIAALGAAGRDPADGAEAGGALALLRARAGDLGGALQGYGRIPRGDHHDYWRAACGYLISDATLARASALASARRFAAAESLATGLERAICEPGVPARCSEFLEWIRLQRAAPSAPSAHTAAPHRVGAARRRA